MSNIFEKALEHAKKIREDKEKSEKEAKERVENERRYIASLQKQVGQALASFDGKFGISCTSENLIKNGNVIASMTVQWGTWDDPNYEYKVEKSGYEIVWKIFDRYGKSIQAGSDLDSFAKYMAIHYLCKFV